MTFDLDAAALNIVPSKYRQVAVRHIDGDISNSALNELFVGRDAYMTTRYIVLKMSGGVALMEAVREGSDDLFSPIERVRLLAEPAECVYLERPHIDVGVPSQMAAVVDEYPEARCIIVEGLYSHVSFMLNPSPFRINVLDIIPPEPSKLFDQAQRVLDVGEDLAPIVLSSEVIDSRDVLAAESDAPRTRILMPCQTSGLKIEGAVVDYLDQRPERADWTLVGCERSVQIHEQFYDSVPEVIDTCPRRFVSRGGQDQGPTLSRCCLLQEGLEVEGRTAFVPWGASLHEVRVAIEALVDSEDFVWTRT